ncbi:MAG: LysR family transcriptional regulator [Oscillospiraceae bacterium]
MEIRDLRYFCLTAELEHVTKAADKLGIAQPFLSRIMGQLEKELGVPLFDNIGRSIKLNQYGEVFYTQAKQLVSQFDNIRSVMDSMIGKQERNLRISTNMETQYPELVMKFQEQNPDYSLSVSFDTKSNLEKSLKAGEVDYVICSPPLPDDPVEGIKTEAIFREYACAILPPKHPMLGKKALTLEDMEGVPFIAAMKGSALRTNSDIIMGRYNYTPQIICESNDLNLIMRTVRNGFGWAIIPRTAAFTFPSIKKFCIESALPDAYGDIGLSYSTLPNIARDGSGYPDFLIKFLKEYNENIYSQHLGN